MAKQFQEFLTGKRRSDDKLYMEMALKAAAAAKSQGDEPVGAVLVFPGGYLVDHDTTFNDRDQTCHAILNLLRKASLSLKRFDDAVLYTTVEPCIMCASAAHFCGLREIVFGAFDEKFGFRSSGLMAEIMDSLVTKGGILAEESWQLLPKLLQEHIRLEKNHE